MERGDTQRELLTRLIPKVMTDEAKFKVKFCVPPFFPIIPVVGNYWVLYLEWRAYQEVSLGVFLYLTFLSSMHSFFTWVLAEILN